MRKFKFEQVNSTPYKGLDGTVIFGDGTDPTHKILIEAVNGLGVPQSIVQTQQAPFQVGASPIRVTYGPRTISLECAIIIDCKNEAGKAAMESVKRDLGKKFSPVGMGYVTDTSLTGSNYSTITGKLSYASDGVTYDRFIDCVPISCEFPNRSYSDGFQRFRLALFCPDPTWYDAEQSSVMTSVPSTFLGPSRAMAYSSSLGLLVAVGFINATDPTILISYDGISWQEPTSYTAAQNYIDVTWSDSLGMFLAVAAGVAVTTYSYDGNTWYNGTPPGAITCIKWSNKLGIFCGVGSSSVYTSSNGTSWATNACPAGTWTDIEWSEELTRFCVIQDTAGNTDIMTSDNGTSWTLRTGTTGGGVGTVWRGIIWSRDLELFVVVGFHSGGSSNVQTSPDGINWTLRIGSLNKNLYGVTWAQKLGMFIACSVTDSIIYISSNGIDWISHTSIQIGRVINWFDELGMAISWQGVLGTYQQVTYNGTNWYRSAAGDYTKQIANDGDVPTDFEIDIPVAGGETGKLIAIGDNFLWAGSGITPSDHNLVFITEGLKKGTVTVSTKFNAKDISQFGVSKFNLYQGGTFFSLYVSGAITNNIYLRNTGTNAGAPTIRWKNRYLGV